MKKYYSVALEETLYANDTFFADNLADCLQYLADNDYELSDAHRVEVWEYDGNDDRFGDGECVDIITEM